MLLFTPNWLFLYPGLLAILFGLVVGGVLLGRPILLDTFVGIGFSGLLQHRAGRGIPGSSLFAAFADLCYPGRILS